MEIHPKYLALTDAIEAGDVDAGVAEAQRLVQDGVSLRDIYLEAITPHLRDIGERFSRLELYLPDMMRAADVVKAIHTTLGGHLSGEGAVENAGTIVIGTIYGDIHDLGKNIVASMLEVNGFQMHDLGINVDTFDFLKKAREVNADIIAISSLLSTSLPYVSDVIQMIKANPADAQKFKILIGGGPVTAEYAAQVGADGFGRDAADAVRQAQALMQKN